MEVNDNSKLIHHFILNLISFQISRDLTHTQPYMQETQNGTANDIQLSNDMKIGDIKHNYNDSSHKQMKVSDIKCPRPKIFFRDDVRSVDFILVWDGFDEEAITEEANTKRKIFEMNLVKEGLELEYEEQENSGLNFIKVSGI